MADRYCITVLPVLESGEIFAITATFELESDMRIEML